jgi:hypothetical protein
MSDHLRSRITSWLLPSTNLQRNQDVHVTRLNGERCKPSSFMTFNSDLCSLELLAPSLACLRQLLHSFLLYLVIAGAAASVAPSSTLLHGFPVFHYVF